MTILGIETSCDETSVALLEIKRGKFGVLSHVVSSSVKEQAKYGGIVPEVAARKQIEYMVPVLNEILKRGISNFQFSIFKKTSKSTSRISKKLPIDAIAVTVGPGLASSLQVGIDTAKSLAYAWQKPIIPVNHLEGHLLSPLLTERKFSIFNFQFSNKPQKSNSKARMPKIKFPAVGLIVSGGHTELILIKDYGKYELLGRTRDDAVGEAFDKVAKLLDLGYPGGPIIDKLAKEGDATEYEFPRGMIRSDDYDFSFSGLKTAVLYEFKKHTNVTAKMQQNMVAGFQQAVIDVLVHKTLKAVKEYGAHTVLLGGGVSANNLLRKTLLHTCEQQGVTCMMSPLCYSGDNAAMIALAGYYQCKTGNAIDPNPQSESWKTVSVQPNMKLV